jgi:myosin heavy subunit
MDSTKNNKMSESKSNQSKVTAWAVIALLALLGLNGYQWYSNSQLKTENVRQETEMIEIEKAQAELEQDYQASLESLEDLKGDNKDLNDLIDSQKKELTAQKEKINNLIWTKRELTKAKKEIENMKNQAATYVAEITELKEQNEYLASTNEQLIQEKQVLADSYQTQMEVNAELEEAKKVLASEKERLVGNNSELSTKVDMANAIKINWLEVKGYEIKDNGDIKGKSKAKDIEMLRTCVKTESNYVTPSGEKEFFVRLINPIGETVFIENNGGGILVNKLDETQVRYSYTGKFDYNNEDTEACLDWVLNDRLAKGEYDLEIYNNGFLVGKGNFKLK